MKRIKLYVATLVVAVLGSMALAVPSTGVAALDPLKGACETSTDNQVCKEVNDPNSNNLGSVLGIVVNSFLFIVGALAVVMIIFSGIQYVTSTGDSGRVSKAKNTLIYSLVGLIVAFLAFALVNWVFKLFTSESTKPPQSQSAPASGGATGAQRPV